MMRRLVILAAGMTVLAIALCALSHVWQFGYVGSRRSVGLREGKLWYVTRMTPISDGEGFYAGDASAINRAMYSIGAQVRWWDKSTWTPVLTVAGLVVYAFILMAVRRRWHRPVPGRLIVAVVVVSALTAGLWTASHLATITFDGTHVHLRLADGTLSMIVERAQGPGGIPWGKGWNVYHGMPPVVVHVEEYFAWRGGEIRGKAPLGVLFMMLILPVMVLVRRDPRALPGHCKRCGYDLTGNVSGVCPECGTRVDPL